ncbi:putative wd repeat protein [Phaeomoniella chlamydospora]|uniref:Probable cytosolic iron-sulfur protein assembly protein 1 n=1 Tax=Phaeomoniella chlamydospora TaxID=158046 RepID=A0A0G2ESL8_PHACM|nr:putative wd repeat protein [Phaeomoniella chlamydospora]
MAADVPPLDLDIPSLIHLATLSPPSSSRAWQSSPHPSLPIVATATSDKSVNIYSLTTFRLLNRVSGGHKRSVRSVGWRRPIPGSATGATVLATGSFDSTVGIWRKEDEFEASNSASVGNEDEVEIRDRPGDADDEEAWAFAVLLTGHDSEVKSLAFSPSNPSLLATSSRDKSVWIWEEVSGAADEDEYETTAVLTEHSGDVKCVAWNYEDDVLASGSYDDSIRLWREVEEEGDWMCVAYIEGHEGTVWAVQWEKPPAGDDERWKVPEGLPDQQLEEWESYANRRGPRIVSSSDDLTIRIWRREYRSGDSERGPLKRNKIPSIIKPSSTTETWVQDAILPQTHSRSVYSVAWSERTGLIASCGGDGNIYVFKEFAKLHRPSASEDENTKQPGDAMSVDSPTATTEESMEELSEPEYIETEWKPIASIEAAHGDFEVNHVCWALRRDKDKRYDEEEVIISTGDDGQVKLWYLPA